MIRLPPSNIRDQLAFFADAASLRRPAFAVIDGLQRTDARGGAQLLGCATALIAMCESANVPVQEVLLKAGRALADSEGPYSTHVRSIRDYAANEIARGK